MQLAPALGGALGAYDPTGGADKSAAISELMKNVSGGYTDPASNPEIQGVINSLQQQSSIAGKQASNQVSQAAQGGGNLFSSAAQKAQGASATQTQTNLDQQIANLLYGNQQAERGRQYGSVNQLLNVGPEQLNQALAMVAALKQLQGSGSQRGQGWGVTGSASASYSPGPAPMPSGGTGMV